MVQRREKAGSGVYVCAICNTGIKCRPITKTTDTDFPEEFDKAVCQSNSEYYLASFCAHHIDNRGCDQALVHSADGHLAHRKCRALAKKQEITQTGGERMAKNEEKKTVVKKAVRKREIPEQHEPASATFPTEAKISKYEFLHFNNDVLAALGLKAKTEHKATIQSVDFQAKTITIAIPDMRSGEKTAPVVKPAPAKTEAA